MKWQLFGIYRKNDLYSHAFDVIELGHLNFRSNRTEMRGYGDL